MAPHVVTAAYCLLGFIAGLVVLAAVVSAGIVLILLKQRKGLHSKKVVPGVYVYAHSRKVGLKKLHHGNVHGFIDC